MTRANEFDEALRLFEELDGLDDAFIEEGMLPDEFVETSPVKRPNPLIRFANSGWGVAMLCVLVSMSVLLAVIHFGIDANRKGSEDAAPDAAPPAFPGYDAEEEGDHEWKGDDPVDDPVRDEVPAETEDVTRPDPEI